MQVSQREAPPSFPLFSRPGAQLRRLLDEQRGGHLIASPTHRLAAIQAAMKEEDPLLRGGIYARHILENAPVMIDPQDIFAANVFFEEDDEATQRATAELAHYPWDARLEASPTAVLFPLRGGATPCLAAARLCAVA